MFAESNWIALDVKTSTGYVMGFGIHMVTVRLSCSPGTHSIGVRTLEYGDGNGQKKGPEASVDPLL